MPIAIPKSASTSIGFKNISLMAKEIPNQKLGIVPCHPREEAGIPVAFLTPAKLKAEMYHVGRTK